MCKFFVLVFLLIFNNLLLRAQEKDVGQYHVWKRLSNDYRWKQGNDCIYDYSMLELHKRGKLKRSSSKTELAIYTVATMGFVWLGDAAWKQYNKVTLNQVIKAKELFMMKERWTQDYINHIAKKTKINSNRIKQELKEMCSRSQDRGRMVDINIIAGNETQDRFDSSKVIGSGSWTDYIGVDFMDVSEITHFVVRRIKRSRRR